MLTPRFFFVLLDNATLDCQHGTVTSSHTRPYRIQRVLCCERYTFFMSKFTQIYQSVF